MYIRIGSKKIHSKLIGKLDSFRSIAFQNMVVDCCITSRKSTQYIYHIAQDKQIGQVDDSGVHQNFLLRRPYSVESIITP